MKTITKVGVLSIAKIQSLITGVIYFILGVIINLLGRGSPELVQQTGLQTGTMALVTYTLTGLIGGFIAGAVIALLYNLLAPRIGGIELELK